jgi:hypothetical protein
MLIICSFKITQKRTTKFGNFINHNMFFSHLMNTCIFVNIICSCNSSWIKHHMVSNHLWTTLLSQNNTTKKCGWSSLIHVQWTNELIASPPSLNHWDQWIHSKFNEITWHTRTHFVVMQIYFHLLLDATNHWMTWLHFSFSLSSKLAIVISHNCICNLKQFCNHICNNSLLVTWCHGE